MLFKTARIIVLIWLVHVSSSTKGAPVSYNASRCYVLRILALRLAYCPRALNWIHEVTKQWRFHMLWAHLPVKEKELAMIMNDRIIWINKSMCLYNRQFSVFNAIKQGITDIYKMRITSITKLSTSIMITEKKALKEFQLDTSRTKYISCRVHDVSIIMVFMRARYSESCWKFIHRQ